MLSGARHRQEDVRARALAARFQFDIADQAPAATIDEQILKAELSPVSGAGAVSQTERYLEPGKFAKDDPHRKALVGSGRFRVRRYQRAVEPARFEQARLQFQ